MSEEERGMNDDLEETSTIVQLTTILIGTLGVLFFIFVGWCVVWFGFLSRFKFVRELLGKSSETDLTTVGNPDSSQPTQPRGSGNGGRTSLRNRRRRD